MNFDAKSKDQVAVWLLRAGLATIFLYAAISSLANPNDWLGYLPQPARDMVDGYLLLKIFAVYELLLVLWLVIGKYVHLAALLAAATLAGIVLANLSLFAIIFRDIALIFAALGLAVLAWPSSPAAKR
jgi:uncharacterized membrane protein YphA (DoxX/SURF4 family)